MDDHHKLLDKLRRIEALFAGAKTDGERMAAEAAIGRISAKLKQKERLDPAVEYRFSLNNGWSRKLFVALLRRYGIRPYRYHRQRSTTVMARVSRSFVDETLWPEFTALDEALREHLDAITGRIIREAISKDSSEVDEIQGALPRGGS